MGALDRKKEKERVRLPEEYNEYNALKMQFPLFSSRRKEWSFRPLYPTMNLELFFFYLFVIPQSHHQTDFGPTDLWQIQTD